MVLVEKATATKPGTIKSFILEIPVASIIHAKNSLLIFTIKQQMPGDSRDVHSTGGTDIRVLFFLQWPGAKAERAQHSAAR